MSEMSVMNNNAAQPAAKKGLFARAVAAVNSRTAKALFKGVAVPLALWLAARGGGAAEAGRPGAAVYLRPSGGQQTGRALGTVTGVPGHADCLTERGA